MDKVTCPHCGQKLQSDWKICAYCGKPLRTKSHIIGDHFTWIWFAFIPGVLVLIALGLYVIVYKPSSPAQVSAESTVFVAQLSLSPTSLLEVTPTSDIFILPLLSTQTYAPSTSNSNPVITPTVKDYRQVFLGDSLLFDLDLDAPDCFDVTGVDYSPTLEYFLIAPNCIEGDNRAFLYLADGSNKREITGEQDYILYGNYDWSPDSRWIVYQRTNSFGSSPIGAPPEGLVLYDIQTSEKILAT